MMEMESKTKKKLSENILEKFSMDFLRNQVLKNAYGNNDTVIAKLDPRILIVWYLFFGLVPWFVNDLWFLMACFLLVVVTTKLARVAGLVLLLRPDMSGREMLEQAYALLRQNWPLLLVLLGLILLWPRGKRRRG